MDQPLQTPIPQKRALQKLSLPIETISAKMDKVFSNLTFEETLVPFFNYLTNLFDLLESAQSELQKINLLEIIYSNIARFNEALFSKPDTQNRICKNLSENPKRLHFSVVSSVLSSINTIKTPDTFRMERKEHGTFKIFCTQIYNALLFTKIPDDPIVVFHKNEKFCETSGSVSHVFERLSQIEPVEGSTNYGTALMMLHFVEVNLTDDFTPKMLAYLLDNSCKLSSNISPRQRIQTCLETLYAYLRFALIGPKPHCHESLDSGQTRAWYSTLQSPTKICEFLQVLLKEEVPVEVLVKALTRKHIAEQVKSEHKIVRPSFLIFYFLNFNEPAKLIVEKIQKSSQCMQALATSILSNIDNQALKSILFERLIQSVINLGNEPLVLKELFTLSLSPTQKRLADNVTSKVAEYTKNGPLPRGIENLRKLTYEKLDDLDKKLMTATETKRVELFWHKKRILLIALEALYGTSADFRLAKAKNPRYNEGMSTSTASLVYSIELELNSTTKSTPTLGR